MNSGNSKDFLLILPFPGYPKESYYYFQPFAFGDFSVLRWEGSVAARTQSHQDTSQSQGTNVSMVPSSRSSGRQYKICPPGTEPPLTPPLTRPILPPVLFHISVPLNDPCPTHTHTQKNGVDWMDFFFLLCSGGNQLSWRVGTCRGKRSGGEGRGVGLGSLKLEGEWSSLAAVAARVSQVCSNGPTWPNLLLVVRWPAPLRGDKARGTLSHSLQPVFVKDSQWLSKNSQVGILQRGSRVCNGGKRVK